jgi:hypothetical protein
VLHLPDQKALLDFPELPNLHALLILILTGVALFLFSRERLPLETSSLILCNE